MRNQRTPPAVRFWAKVNKDGPVHPTLGTACWLWTAGTKEGGYGIFGLGGKYGGNILAHRWAWEEANGPVPDGLFVCHHCDTPPCVRPSHHFLGTALENSHDAQRKGRLRGRNTGKTHCDRGHPLSGENLYVYRDHRACFACRHIARQASWDRAHPNVEKRGPRARRLPSRKRSHSDSGEMEGAA